MNRALCIRGTLRWCAAVCLMSFGGAMAEEKGGVLKPLRDLLGKERTILASRDGYAVFYSRGLNGGRTADGGRLDNSKFTAAHSTYPFGTIVMVTRVRNGKSVEVRVTDHLPSTKTNRKLGIIIDLTRAAASKLDMLKDGRAKVKVEVLKWGTKKQRS
jgi:rare lipoprotein A